jgi:FtsZ-binding cell division protein ZapB
MTDPLSITASVVSVTVPALHGIRLLQEDLQQLKEAPKTVKHLLGDVQSVDTSLELLRAVEHREWDLLGTSIVEESKTTISRCAQACDLFRTDLEHWTRHSKGGKLAWQDRTSVGFFKQGQIKAMSEQLQNCRLSINSVVSTATL